MNETTLTIILASTIGGFVVIASVGLAIFIIVRCRKKRSGPARTSVKSSSNLPLDLSSSLDDDVFHPSALPPPPFDPPRWTGSYDKPEPTYATAGMNSFSAPGKPNFPTLTKTPQHIGKENSGFLSDDSGYTTLHSADGSFYASHSLTSNMNGNSQTKSNPQQKRITVVDSRSTEPYAIIDILNLNGKNMNVSVPQKEVLCNLPPAGMARGIGRGNQTSWEMKPQPVQEQHIYFELEKQDNVSELSFESESDAPDGGGEDATLYWKQLPDRRRHNVVLETVNSQGKIQRCTGDSYLTGEDATLYWRQLPDRRRHNVVLEKVTSQAKMQRCTGDSYLIGEDATLYWRQLPDRRRHNVVLETVTSQAKIQRCTGDSYLTGEYTTLYWRQLPHRRRYNVVLEKVT
ncbi:hypothetical protein Btru_055700 [Bulinus truncatus]|nr:hypothetical protein Btru_055700 [Bulinus truncatus]